MSAAAGRPVPLLHRHHHSMAVVLRARTLQVALLLILPSFATSQEAAAVYGTFYPSNINQTQWITDNSIGTYGGVYHAGTYSSHTSSRYGNYDYCSMPHPRAREYTLPEPVARSQVKAGLVFVNYVQRHQRRTPYNILPGGENQPYFCDNVEPFLYAGPGADVHAQQPAHVYAQTYFDPANPFAQSFVQGTCQYPQLTIGGLLDGYQHGRDLWRVYGERLQFLPSSPDSATWFRSSESPLTQQSAGGVLRGIWPGHDQPVPIHQQASAVDSVNAGFPCSLRGKLLSYIQSTPQWKAHLEATAPLLAQLSPLTMEDSAWTSTFDHLSDNFQARLCNGYALPCNVNNSSDCVTQEQADEVFRAGDWEWNYYWRANPKVKQYIWTTQGLYISELLDRFTAVQNHSSTLKYVHEFLHDGDIGPICGALGITALRWPGMASNLAFELWQVSSGGLFARVLYSGQPIETVHGRLDWIPLQQLVDILKPFVPENIVTLCSQ